MAVLARALCPVDARSTTRPGLGAAGILPAADAVRGVGLSHIALSGGHPAIGEIGRPGYQLALLSQPPSTPALALALALGGSGSFDVGAVATDTDPFYPPDRAEYGFIEFGARFYPVRADYDQTRAFVSLGWGLHTVVWKHYVFDQTGAGFTLGAGLQVPLDRRWYLDLGAYWTQFDSDQVLFADGEDPPRSNQVRRVGLELLYRLGGGP